jgi:hypothetical protein
MAKKHEYVKNEILYTNPGGWVKKLPLFFFLKRKKRVGEIEK